MCNWSLVDNLYWIVPSVFSLGAIIALAISTNKQIKTSKGSTKLQIENQNKESHRPYVKMKTSKEVEKEKKEINFFIEIKYKDEKDNESSHFEEMIFENLGYGIARDIKFVPISDNIAISEQTSRLCDERVIFPIIDINSNEKKKIIVQLNLKNKNNRISIAVLYRDLNQNMFISIITISDVIDGKLRFTYTTEDSLRFKNDVEMVKFDKEKIMFRYENFYRK
jgi:hypothetical protein